MTNHLDEELVPFPVKSVVYHRPPPSFPHPPSRLSREGGNPGGGRPGLVTNHLDEALVPFPVESVVQHPSLVFPAKAGTQEGGGPAL